MNQSELPSAEVQRVFVFTDLVNSTGVKSQMPGRDRAYRDGILFPHRERVERDLKTYGGRVVETAGDGYVLPTFGELAEGRNNLYVLLYDVGERLETV